MKSKRSEEVEILSCGICACSVCALKTMSRKEVERQVNILSPTGINSRWKISKDKTFRQGQTNPCICERDSKRMHYLLNC